MQALIYRVIAKQHVKRQKADCTHPTSSVFIHACSGGTKWWRALAHRMITKQQVKNEQIKRKQTSPASFVKVFKFQDDMFKIVQQNFQAIIVNKIYLENPLALRCHDDHYMINMGGQRPKIGGN